MSKRIVCFKGDLKMDLFDELIEEKESFCNSAESKALKLELEKEKAVNQRLMLINQDLTQKLKKSALNISSLIKTCRTEINRKNGIISTLRKELESGLIRKTAPGNCNQMFLTKTELNQILFKLEDAYKENTEKLELDSECVKIRQAPCNHTITIGNTSVSLLKHKHGSTEVKKTTIKDASQEQTKAKRPREESPMPECRKIIKLDTKKEEKRPEIFRNYSEGSQRSKDESRGNDAKRDRCKYRDSDKQYDSRRDRERHKDGNRDRHSDKDNDQRDRNRDIVRGDKSIRESSKSTRRDSGYRDSNRDRDRGSYRDSKRDRGGYRDRDRGCRESNRDKECAKRDSNRDRNRDTPNRDGGRTSNRDRNRDTPNRDGGRTSNRDRNRDTPSRDNNRDRNRGTPSRDVDRDSRYASKGEDDTSKISAKHVPENRLKEGKSSSAAKQSLSVKEKSPRMALNMSNNRTKADISITKVSPLLSSVCKSPLLAANSNQDVRNAKSQVDHPIRKDSPRSDRQKAVQSSVESDKSKKDYVPENSTKLTAANAARVLSNPLVQEFLGRKTCKAPEAKLQEALPESQPNQQPEKLIWKIDRSKIKHTSHGYNTYFGPEPPEDLKDMDSVELDALISTTKEILSSFKREENKLKTDIQSLSSNEKEDGECSSDEERRESRIVPEPVHHMDESAMDNFGASANKTPQRSMVNLDHDLSLSDATTESCWGLNIGSYNPEVSRPKNKPRYSSGSGNSGNTQSDCNSTKGIADILRGSLLSEKGYVSPSTGMIKTPTSNKLKEQKKANTPTDKRTSPKVPSKPTTATDAKRKRANKLLKELGLDDSNSCSNFSPIKRPTQNVALEQSLGLEISSSSGEEEEDKEPEALEKENLRAFVKRRRTLGMSTQ